MKKNNGGSNYFSPEARDERRAERVKNASKLSGTFNKVASHYTAAKKLTTQNAGLSAVAFVRGIISHYRMPSEPKLGYSGIRNVRTAAHSSTVMDGVIIVTASVRTPSNVYINFDIPVEIRDGQMLEPSVIVHHGAPRVIAQSTFDEITTRHTAHEVKPVREMYAKPLDKKVSDHLYSHRVKTTRRSPGMFSVKANRDEIRRAIGLGTDVEVVLHKTATMCGGPGPSGDGACPNEADPDFEDELCTECAAEMANTYEPDELKVPGLDDDSDDGLESLGLETKGLDKAMDGMMQEPSKDILKKKYMSSRQATPRPVVPKPHPIKPPKMDPPKTTIAPNPAPKAEAPKPYKPPKVETPKAPKPPNMRSKPDKNRPCTKCGFAPCRCPNKRKKKNGGLQAAFARAAKSVLNHDIKFVRDAQAVAIDFPTMRMEEGIKRNVEDYGSAPSRVMKQIPAHLSATGKAETVYQDENETLWGSESGDDQVSVLVNDGKFRIVPAENEDKVSMPPSGAKSYSRHQVHTAPTADDSFDSMSDKVDEDLLQPPHSGVPRNMPVSARVAAGPDKEEKPKSDKKDDSKKKTLGPDDLKKQLSDHIQELLDSGAQQIDIKLLMHGDPVTGSGPMFEKAGPDVLNDVMKKFFGDKDSSFHKTGPEKKKAQSDKRICSCDCGCGTPVKGNDDKCLECRKNYCK